MLFLCRVVTQAKFNLFHLLVEQEKSELVPYGTALLAMLACNLAFVLAAWYTVYLEPLAAGSGIPEIKCFLNGINIPRVVSIKTLVCKIIGIIFSCSAGLPLGKEGPMVHAGAVIAAAVSQVERDTLFFFSFCFLTLCFSFQFKTFLSSYFQSYYCSAALLFTI